MSTKQSKEYQRIYQKAYNAGKRSVLKGTRSYSMKKREAYRKGYVEALRKKYL